MQGLGAAVGGETLSTGQVGRIPEAGYKPPRAGMENAKKATPEQQQKYNEFVSFSMQALYDEKFMGNAIKLIKTARSPVEGIARVAASVASRVYISAKKNGYDLPGEVILHGGAEVLELVKEMAEASGVAALDEDQTESAFYLAADIFRSSLDGRGMIDKGAVMQDIQEFRRMEEAGELDETAARFGPKSLGAATGQPAPEDAPPGPAPQPPEPEMM